VSPTGPVRARVIDPADLEQLALLLPRGYPNRSSDYFRTIFRRLSEHSTPSRFPKYGYLLESGGNAVGAILVIYSSTVVGQEMRVRGNFAYWYVEPLYRSFAALLPKLALAHKDVTFLNLSSGRHTRPILEAQGYRRYIAGEFVCIPAVSPKTMRARVSWIAEDDVSPQELTPFELRLCKDHVSFGCIAVRCTAADETQPFVFQRLRRPGRIPVPYARLVYCRELEAFLRFAGPVGRFLALRGTPLVSIDSNGPLTGLFGKYSVAKTPKYFKGPNPPRLGDFAYTERVMFDN
jgi:hypothetical protein